MDRNLLSILIVNSHLALCYDPIYSRPCCTPPPPPPPRHMQKLMNSGRSVPRSKYSGDGNTACKNQTWHPVPSPAYSQLTKAGPVLLLFEGCFNGGTSQSRWNFREIHIGEPMVMQILDKELHGGMIQPSPFISSQPTLSEAYVSSKGWIS